MSGTSVSLEVALQEPIFSGTQEFSQCHASTLVVMPDGDIVCAWFGGTREGATDVAIWGAVRHAGRWCKPFEIARHPNLPTWNPVLFFPNPSLLSVATPNAYATCPTLYLFYRVGITIPEWRGYVKTSKDGGYTWSQPESMPAGILGPIKNKPIVLSDGAWLAGSSVETATEWFCRMEFSNDCGGSWVASEPIKFPHQPQGLIQPTLWESAPGRVHALMRSRGIGRICRTDSIDGGRTWSLPYATTLPNPNSGIDVTRLMVDADSATAGQHTNNEPLLVLVYNPVETGRTPLVVAISTDNGASWQNTIVLENTPGEFSYPAVVPTPDGLAITYTHQRTSIQFALLRVKYS